MPEITRSPRATVHIESLEVYNKLKEICSLEHWYIRHLVDYSINNFLKEYADSEGRLRLKKILPVRQNRKVNHNFYTEI